jgi:hypothetical protein
MLHLLKVQNEIRKKGEGVLKRYELDFEPDRLIRKLYLRNRVLHKGVKLCL